MRRKGAAMDADTASDPTLLAVDQAEAARRLSVSTRTIFTLREQGKIGFIRPGGTGGKVLIPVDELRRYVRENKQTAAEVTA
jgi:excisionase family DNA binding protein